MKRIVLAGLTVLTLAVTAASPASAINTRFRDAHQMHNDLTGKAFTPALTSEANLTQRFKDARDANLNKLNPRFKDARDANLNKLNPRFESAVQENRNKR
jgi:Spy/CpxP family protein refolding chaperone